MENNLLYELALTLIHGIGNALVRQLISYGGSAEKVLKLPKGKLMKIPGIGEKLAESILDSTKALKIAEEQLKLAEKSNTQILFYTSPAYPQRLRNLYDAPAILFWQGNSDLNTTRTIGIVGTRNASEYGKNMTERIIEDLKQHNPLIISGLAYGIDIAAHKAALKYGLQTIGVMGNGMQKIYPQVHQKTADQMKTQGGLLTEYLFGTEPAAPHFPNRNRIIAGLSDVIIVVETSYKGGTLITVELAHEYKKPIFAVPGMLGAKTSEGCNDLIQRKQALIYTKGSDVEEITGWLQNQEMQTEIKTENIDFQYFTPEELAIYQTLQGQGEIQIDELAWKTQINISQVATVLLTLEFKNLVKALPGKKFKLANS